MRGIGCVLLLPVVLCAAGCSSNPVKCSGASAESPHVELATAAWWVSHSGAEMTACFNGACQSVVPQARSAGPAHLKTGHSTTLGMAMLLTVRATRAGQGILDARVEVHLHEIKPDEASGPCGKPPAAWLARAVLDANGHLTTT